MAGPHQPTVACSTGKDLCVKPLWFVTTSMTQLMLTDPPPLLGPTQTTPVGTIPISSRVSNLELMATWSLPRPMIWRGQERP